MQPQQQDGYDGQQSSDEKSISIAADWHNA